MESSSTDQETPKTIDNKIYVLPCLQELKTAGTFLGGEKEQQAGYWNGTNTIALNKYAPRFAAVGTSNMFDSMWNGSNTDLSKEEYITKNGLLDIPNMNEFGFQSECKNMQVQNKWAMYVQFLQSKFANSDTNQQNTALFVSHHNRMKSSDPLQGIIPLKKAAQMSCNAYANNFCVMIEVNGPDDIQIQVVFPGFPDKGDLALGCEKNTIGQIGGGAEKQYCCQATLEQINQNVIKEGIVSGLDVNNVKPFTVFVIRHGNSLHNQPLNQHVLDSSLTPLGIYQASKLGESLKSEYGAKFKGNVLLCSSFLQRTQLTGLCILQKILDVDDKGWSIGPDIATTLNKGYQSLLTIAITRYNKYRNQQKGLCVFKGFDPLKGDSNYDDFITFCGTLPDVNPLNECTLPVKKGWFSGGKNRQMYKKTRKARLNGIRIKGKSIKGKSIKGKSIKGKSTRRSNGSKRHTRKRSHA